MNIKEFFYFQKSDRHVLMVLLGIAIVFMSLVYFLGSDEMEENEADGVLSQMSNMSDRTKSLFKRTMDEYPPLDEDTLYEQSQNK